MRPPVICIAQMHPGRQTGFIMSLAEAFPTCFQDMHSQESCKPAWRERYCGSDSSSGRCPCRLPPEHALALLILLRPDPEATVVPLASGPGPQGEGRLNTHSRGASASGYANEVPATCSRPGSASPASTPFHQVKLREGPRVVHSPRTLSVGQRTSSCTWVKTGSCPWNPVPLSQTLPRLEGLCLGSNSSVRSTLMGPSLGVVGRHRGAA